MRAVLGGQGGNKGPPKTERLGGHRRGVKAGRCRPALTRVADQGVEAARVLVEEWRHVVHLALNHQPTVLVAHVLLALRQRNCLGFRGVGFHGVAGRALRSRAAAAVGSGGGGGRERQQAARLTPQLDTQFEARVPTAQTSGRPTSSCAMTNPRPCIDLACSYQYRRPGETLSRYQQ